MINVDKFYKQWCKDTKRSGGILIGPSIKELLRDFARTVTMKEANDAFDAGYKRACYEDNGVVVDHSPNKVEYLTNLLKE